jgi:hypothetical protein
LTQLEIANFHQVKGNNSDKTEQELVEMGDAPRVGFGHRKVKKMNKGQ